jgi:UV DNA damage repair endonuclease
MNTKYGLICISKLLQEEDSSNQFAALSRKQYASLSSEKGEEEALNTLSDQVLSNLELTIRIIDHCRANNIDHYRLNTSIFGLLSDSSFDIEFSDLPNQEVLNEAIRDIGRTSITKGVSLSIQPDKFCKLIDKDESIVDKSVKELNFYSWFLDQVGAQENISAPICLHLNSQPESNDHETFCDFADKFYENFKGLDSNTQKKVGAKKC